MRTCNLNTQDMLDSIRLIRGGSLPQNGYLKAVYVKQNNEWQFLIGKLVFVSEYRYYPIYA